MKVSDDKGIAEAYYDFNDFFDFVKTRQCIDIVVSNVVER